MERLSKICEHLVKDEIRNYCASLKSSAEIEANDVRELTIFYKIKNGFGDPRLHFCLQGTSETKH